MLWWQSSWEPGEQRQGPVPGGSGLSPGSPGLPLQSVLQQRHSPGDAGEDARPPSILSYLAACDFDVPARSKPPNPAESSEGDSFSSEDQKGAESRSTTPALKHGGLPPVIIQGAGAEGLQHPPAAPSTLDILRKTPCGDGFPSPSSFPSRHKGTRGSFRNRRLAEQENISQKSWNAANELKAEGRAKTMDRTLQELLNLLKWREQGQELQKLQSQVSSLRDKLKVGPCSPLGGALALSVSPG